MRFQSCKRKQKKGLRKGENDMLREFWNIVRVSFRKRFILYYLIILSMTLFGTFPNLIVKLVAFFVFVAASILFVPIFTSQFISTIRWIVAHFRRERFPVSFEIASLSKRIGTQAKEFGIVKGCTAYIWMKTLVLGKELLDRLTFDERQAVIAHELGHIKDKRTILRVILPILLLAVPLYSWSTLYSPIFFSKSLTQIILTVMLNIALLAFVMVVTIPINWHIEFRADQIAAKFAGKGSIKSALLKLENEKNLKEPSETHPSIAERVKAIEKLEI